MNHITPEKDKDKNPEKPAPELPESIMMPEIKKTREEVEGKVKYSVDQNEIGLHQAPADAYRQATTNHLASLAGNEPNWLQKALATRKIHRKQLEIITDDIGNRREEQNRHADLLNSKQLEDWLALQARLENERARWAKKQAITRENKYGGVLKGFLSTLGEGLAGFWYGMRRAKDRYNKEKLEK